jgi:hypothetical protein
LAVTGNSYFKDNIGIGTTDTSSNKLNVLGNTTLGGDVLITGLINQNNSSQSNIFLGKVGIGINNNFNYNLNVDGSINTTSINIGGISTDIIYTMNNNLPNILSPYTTSNICKNLILYDTPNVIKKFGFLCTLETIIYPNNNQSTIYYKFDINLDKYTSTKLDNNNDPYRIFKINIFPSSCYFGTITSEVPDILSYEIYMSNKSSAGSSSELAGVNICAIGYPINYKLDKVMPNNIFIMKDNSPNINYISILSSRTIQVRCIIVDLLN